MATNAGRSPLNILLVEDHPLIAQMTVAMLRQLGHKPSHAATIAAAAQALGGGQFDVLLCDFSLPDGNAYDLARQFDGDLPPAVLLTAYDSESMPGPTFNAGPGAAAEGGNGGPAPGSSSTDHFKATLQKPVDPAHLDRVLREVTTA